MGSKFPPASAGCSACGSDEFVKALRVGGWWRQHISTNGEIIETDMGSVRYGADPKTLTCAECGKRHVNDIKVW